VSREIDTEYYEESITAIAVDEGGWEVSAGGWTCWVPDRGVEPHVGDVIRWWGKGVGSPFRGIAINGQVVFYKTEAEQKAEWERETRERERKRREEYDRNKADHDARIQAFPEPFRDRIEGFRRRNPDFGWRHESYELMCCEDATRIANALPTVDAIKAWYDLPWDEQKAKVPGINDGHSGNSFGAAVSLAATYLQSPELVPQMHGTLCPLVGCESYGCWATEAA
jgi:hypothetical protein